ncbi:MAG TPA: cysteine desulfurase NifS [Firmicutes bacterium]|jgi:cysteine desulfurase|nr:cysteine desulfurase NifS [Bacillota bacterium]
MEAQIYFDNSATTPVDPKMAEKMSLFIRECYGNPSSMHKTGREARNAVEEARKQVADLLHANPGEVVFTGSGTEADNLALVGVFDTFGDIPFHLITSKIEHPAILESCRYLEKRGADITYLEVDASGLVNPVCLEKAFRPSTRLVSIMTANNVVGTIQPIRELARITHQHGAIFHTDAVQALGRIPLDFWGDVDLVSVSAHKIYGPKGVGALYIRSGLPLEPLLHGGGQEAGRRSSTENVPGIIGFEKAAEIARNNMAGETARLVQLRERLIDGILERINNAYLIGHRHLRLPGHVSVGFAGQEGEAIKLLLALDEAGIAISAGSACSSGHAAEPSYVLQALGFDPLKARGGLRITLGRFNTVAEEERFLDILPGVVREMRPITSRNIASRSNVSKKKWNKGELMIHDSEITGNELRAVRLPDL